MSNQLINFNTPSHKVNVKLDPFFLHYGAFEVMSFMNHDLSMFAPAIQKRPKFSFLCVHGC